MFFPVQVELDDYLIKGQGHFFPALRQENLASALASTPPLLLVSGVCMLRVLEHFNVRPGVLIYIKRMARWGWADEDEVQGNFIEQLKRTVGGSDGDWQMQVEVRDYHRTYRPQDRATIILERQE